MEEAGLRELSEHAHCTEFTRLRENVSERESAINWERGRY